MEINVEVSARHVHLTEKDALVLFGKNISFSRELSQPHQFLSKERVKIIGTKGEFDNVAVLGPYRNQTQVELSITDCFKVGIKGIIRESGDLSGTPGCKILGPNGEISLKEGVIVAKRHIHMNENDSALLRVKDNTICKVRITNTDRALIFDDVVIRINKNFSLSMHVDTDEANAFNFRSGIKGEIIL